jgi:hypothetical protein
LHIGTTDDLLINDAAKSVFDFWSALPRERGQVCPKRLEMEMASLPSLVAKNVFLLTRLDHAVMSATEIGSAITDFLGERLDGQNLVDKHGSNQMLHEQPYYDAIFSGPCAGKLTRHTTDENGVHADFTSVHLPLLDYENKVRYLIGIAEITNIGANKKPNARIMFDQSIITERLLVDIGADVPNIEIHSSSP